MEVVEREFYHVHRKNMQDDEWYVGNQIVFDKSYYNVFFSFYVNNTLEKKDSSIPSDIKLAEYAMLIRELVYEEVRMTYFSHLPSRRHCIWLCDEPELQLWKNTLGDDYEVYKVLATGNLHECYAGSLENNEINYKVLYEKAQAYWRGECIGNPGEKEYLFEGEIEIIEKI